MSWLNRKNMGNCRGFALAAAMMVLALLSILEVAAIQSTTLEVQISGRDRDSRLALYLAQSALEEARYYAARGWGKLGPAATVSTPSPPGLAWDGNRYKGFTLLDSQGDTFTVQSHTSGANPLLAMEAGTPAPGRFLLHKVITGSTSWSGNQLTVDDSGWTDVSGADTWIGWLLWDEAGKLYEVTHSGTTPPGAPTRVVLTVSPSPSPLPSGPYVLSRNPWLSALAAGTAPAGDADSASPNTWDRVFFSASGQEIGTGRVTARLLRTGAYAGTYELAAAGEAGMSRREAALHVFQAGRPSQRVRDWKVR
jgi:type II secretory pathway pseudopilin PulG